MFCLFIVNTVTVPIITKNNINAWALFATDDRLTNPHVPLASIYLGL